MNVLIVGGTGCISTATTRALLARGDSVTLFNRGERSAEFDNQVRVVNGDRDDPGAFVRQMRELETFDCVIDMICFNATQAQSLIDAFDKRTPQVVFCSTVDVYPKPAPYYPIKEDFALGAQERFEYAYAKVACERLLAGAAARGAFALTVLRPAATYMDSWGPLPLLGTSEYVLRRIRDGLPIIVPGDGTSLWGSAHRDDVGPAFAAAAGNRGAFNRCYNVTAEQVHTWSEIYTACAHALGVPPPRFVAIPSKVLLALAPETSWTDMNFKYSNVFDNSAARTDLGYRYTITWPQGAARQVADKLARNVLDTAPDCPLYDQVIDRWEMLLSQLG